MPLFLAERTLPMGTGTLELDSGAKRLIATLEGPAAVRWVRSFLATDRSCIFYQLEAPDADACRAALAKAGLTVERVIPIAELLPEMYLDDPDPDAAGPTGQTWY